MSEYEMMKAQQNKKAASEITNLVNDMCFDYKGVVKQLQVEHRALQENFTRLCVEWLITCGSPDYKFDERNIYSHRIGMMFNEAINNINNK